MVGIRRCYETTLVIEATTLTYDPDNPGSVKAAGFCHSLQDSQHARGPKSRSAGWVSHQLWTHRPNPYSPTVVGAPFWFPKGNVHCVLELSSNLWLRRLVFTATLFVAEWSIWEVCVRLRLIVSSRFYQWKLTKLPHIPFSDFTKMFSKILFRF